MWKFKWLNVENIKPMIRGESNQKNVVWMQHTEIDFCHVLLSCEQNTREWEKSEMVDAHEQIELENLIRKWCHLWRALQADESDCVSVCAFSLDFSLVIFIFIMQMRFGM